MFQVPGIGYGLTLLLSELLFPAECVCVCVVSRDLWNSSYFLPDEVGKFFFFLISPTAASLGRDYHWFPNQQ